MPRAEHHRVVVMGAGFAGIGMGVQLRRRGIEDFVICSLESQIAYVVDALRRMERDGVRRVELQPAALTEYVRECDERSEGSVWTEGGCKAYYTDEDGRNFAIYPGFVSEYRRRTRRFDPEPYALELSPR